MDGLRNDIVKLFLELIDSVKFDDRRALMLSVRMNDVSRTLGFSNFREMIEESENEGTSE